MSLAQAIALVPGLTRNTHNCDDGYTAAARVNLRVPDGQPENLTKEPVAEEPVAEELTAKESMSEEPRGGEPLIEEPLRAENECEVDKVQSETGQTRPASTKKLRVAFKDFWRGLKPDNNTFLRMIQQEWPQYQIITDQTCSSPDILFFSCFHRRNTSQNGGMKPNYLKEYPNTLIVFYTGENKRPDFTRCDLALTFDWSRDPRNYRLPLYFMRKQRILEEGLRRSKLLPTIGQQILDTKQGFCCFLVSNGAGSFRNKVFRELTAYKKVDSGGRYMNNLGHRVARGETQEWISRHKFMICFENSEYPGYTTEKLPNAYTGGTVPIYWGNPMVDRDFNTRAFVNYYDYGSIKRLIRRVIELDTDDAKYLAMLQQPLFPDNQLPTSISERAVADFIHEGYLRKSSERCESDRARAKKTRHERKQKQKQRGDDHKHKETSSKKKSKKAAKKHKKARR